MIKKSLKSKAFLIVTIVCGILIVLDMFTDFYIKSGITSKFIYGIGLVGLYYYLHIAILNTQKNDGFKLCCIAFIVVLSPFVLIMCWLLQENWKTQTIIYEDKISPNDTIEHQMKDTGALGYASRTVQVTYFTPIFMLIKPVDENNINPQEWVKVNKNIDEMGLGEF